MDIEKRFKEVVSKAKEALKEESSFERLLKALVNYGMDEEVAAQMIADCIDEQYELDSIRDELSNIYHEASDTLFEDGEHFDA